VADDKVICTIVASSDCSEEISFARKKADVLEQVLGKPIHFLQAISDQPLPEITVTGKGSLRPEAGPDGMTY
jgi:hypothetical protein